MEKKFLSIRVARQIRNAATLASVVIAVFMAAAVTMGANMAWFILAAILATVAGVSGALLVYQARENNNGGEYCEC